MRRRARAALLLLAAAGVGGCRSAAQPIGVPLRERTRWESEWQSYQRLGAEKALALAGDRQGQFVIGIAFGRATREEAVQAALDECAQRRADRRLDDACSLYAAGDEIVGH